MSNSLRQGSRVNFEHEILPRVPRKYRIGDDRTSTGNFAAVTFGTCLARDTPSATGARSAFYGNLRVLRAFVVHILYMNHDNY